MVQSMRGHDMTEMNMALKMIDIIENLPPADFVTEYNKMTGENIAGDKVTWNGFPVCYDPED